MPRYLEVQGNIFQNFDISCFYGKKTPKIINFQFFFSFLVPKMSRIFEKGSKNIFSY